MVRILKYIKGLFIVAKNVKKLTLSLFSFLAFGLFISSIVPANADMMKKEMAKEMVMEKQQMVTDKAMMSKDDMMKKVIVSDTGYFPSFDQTGFEEAMAKGEKVLVHINASWCSTCKLQRDVLLPEVTTGDYGDVTFYSLDFDDDKDFMDQFDVTERSTILMFNDGQQVARIDRSKDKALIVSKTRMAFGQ